MAGIVLSVQRAHGSLAPGSVRYSKGFVAEEANINRSPTSTRAPSSIIKATQD